MREPVEQIVRPRREGVIYKVIIAVQVIKENSFVADNEPTHELRASTNRHLTRISSVMLQLL